MKSNIVEKQTVRAQMSLEQKRFRRMVLRMVNGQTTFSSPSLKNALKIK